MRVLFCDIDGVVNSMRSCMAFGSYPWDVDEENLKLFDHVALGLIRQLCKDGDIKIVLTSTWRIGDKVYPKMAKALDLPIIDRTSYSLSGGGEYGRRGDEIAQYLEDHPEITQYVILDDEVYDMNPEQRKHIVKTDGNNGLSFEKYIKLRKMFDIFFKT